MSTGKRSVTQHVRADGQKQTANRVGGQFDDKHGAAGAGTAADPFGTGLASAELQETRSLLDRRRVRRRAEMKRLQRESERAEISEMAVDLYEAFPEVAEWRAVGKGSDFTLTEVELHDGSVATPTLEQVQAWQRTEGTALMSEHDSGSAAIVISADGKQTGLRNNHRVSFWPTADPRAVDDGQELTVEQLNSALSELEADRDRAIERHARVELSSRLATMQQAFPGIHGYRVQRLSENGEVQMYGYVTEDGEKTDLYDIPEEGSSLEDGRTPDEVWDDIGDLDPRVFTHGSDCVIVSIEDGAAAVRNERDGRLYDSWKLRNPDAEPLTEHSWR